MNGKIVNCQSHSRGKIRAEGSQKIHVFHVSQMIGVDRLDHSLIGREVTFNNEQCLGAEKTAAGGIPSVKSIVLV